MVKSSGEPLSEVYAQKKKKIFFFAPLLKQWEFVFSGRGHMSRIAKIIN